MHENKGCLYENIQELTSYSKDLGLFFFRTLIPVIIFPETLFSEKSPRKLKLRTLFPKTFCPRTSENWDFFNQSFFFQKQFFLSYIDSTFSIYFDNVSRIQSLVLILYQSHLYSVNIRNTKHFLFIIKGLSQTKELE